MQTYNFADGNIQWYKRDDVKSIEYSKLDIDSKNYIVNVLINLSQKSKLYCID